MKGSRERLHEIIFEADTPAGKRFDVLLLWLIVASVVTVMAETVPDWHDRYRGTFVALEWVFTGLHHRIHHPAARGQATVALRHQLFRPG